MVGVVQSLPLYAPNRTANRLQIAGSCGPVNTSEIFYPFFGCDNVIYL